MTPDPYFPCLSPESATPRNLPAAALLEELERELQQRRAYYPGRVEKGIMDREAAEQGIDLMQLLAEDVRVDMILDTMFADMPDGVTPPVEAWAPLQRQQEVAAALVKATSWADIIARLQQEITQRRHYYPIWVTKKTIDQATARAQLERIEAVHYRWWVLGHHFRADIADRDAWRSAWRDHASRFDPSSDRGAYRPVPKMVQYCGTAQFDHLDPGDRRAPWIRAERYPDGPSLCDCGHHEGYHAHDRRCLFFRDCKCTGIPRESVTRREAFR